MPDGPGKYDDLATLVREAARADAVIVLVLGGIRGNGFEVQAHGYALAEVKARLSSYLRELADKLDADSAQG